MFDVVYSLLQYLLLLVDIIIVNFCVPAGLRDSCDGFAYSIDAKEGGYVELEQNKIFVKIWRDLAKSAILMAKPNFRRWLT